MAADIIIFKRRGQKFKVKITKGMKNGHVPHSYDLIVNLENYRDLGLFLEDLKMIHNAPVDKAYAFMKEQQGAWPF